MQNLSIGKLRKKIRKLERKITGEKTAWGNFFDAFKKKLISPVGIVATVAAVIGSATLGWFSYKKIAKRRSLKPMRSAKVSKNIAASQETSSYRAVVPLLINVVGLMSTLTGLFFGSKKSK